METQQQGALGIVEPRLDLPKMSAVVRNRNRTRWPMAPQQEVRQRWELAATAAAAGWKARDSVPHCFWDSLNSNLVDREDLLSGRGCLCNFWILAVTDKYFGLLIVTRRSFFSTDLLQLLPYSTLTNGEHCLRLISQRTWHNTAPSINACVTHFSVRVVGAWSRSAGVELTPRLARMRGVQISSTCGNGECSASQANPWRWALLPSTKCLLIFWIHHCLMSNPPVPIKTCIFVPDNHNIFPDFQDFQNTAVTRAQPGACDFEISSHSGLWPHISLFSTRVATTRLSRTWRRSPPLHHPWRRGVFGQATPGILDGLALCIGCCQLGEAVTLHFEVKHLRLSRCGQDEGLVHLREDAVTSLLESRFHFRDAVPRVLDLLLVAQDLLLLIHPGVDAPGCTSTVDGIHVPGRATALHYHVGNIVQNLPFSRRSMAWSLFQDNFEPPRLRWKNDPVCMKKLETRSNCADENGCMRSCSDACLPSKQASAPSIPHIPEVDVSVGYHIRRLGHRGRAASHRTRSTHQTSTIETRTDPSLCR